MTIAEVLLSDFDAEAANTRRVLGRVPDEHAKWKPHEKSFALANMAFHVATLPAFGKVILDTESLDLGAGSGSFPRYNGQGADEMLAMYSAHVEALRGVLAGMSDDELQKPWKMTFGEHTIADAPRYVLYRTMYLNHMVHHRGQLNVYLRLLNIKVPGIYGPSADEPFGA